MIFHSQLALSPNQHLNPALTSCGMANLRFANICFCKPLVGFLNQRDQYGEISALFCLPPKLFLFDEILECQRTVTGTESTAGTGVPNLHVNSFPEWLQRAPFSYSRESTMRLSNVIVTELISVSQAEHVICQPFPTATVLFSD
ncbi:hypothetical protein CEXT_536321 [Caerostris extrusa]|uniref:Uncharacterized protein n=1 Tax=Caerostris extrusa TaxID=172846 RepID=A0AAV4PLW6_CAEEX|nr:hypothetical protein CEXT_536321 [Caerostris extrusa]